MIINRRNVLKSLAVSSAILAAPSELWAAARAKVLKIGLSAYPSNFKPWIDIGYSGQLVLALINRSVLTYDEKGQLVGDLAESWKNDGGTSWIFKLRDAKFSNGQPVTSSDVKWTIEEIINKQNGAHMHDAFGRLSGVEVIDDKQFRLKTEKTDVTVPSLMAYPFFCVLQANSTTSQEQGVGAGPYFIASAEKGVGITLQASPHYFKQGLPNFETVQITPYEDENLRVAALSAGDVHLIDYVPWAAMKSIENDPKLNLDAISSGSFMFMYFNGAGVFKDPRLRQAVNFGIRRQEIVDNIFYGRGAPLTGVPRPDTSPFYSKELANYWSYNPDRARSLLKEAGHENGLEVTLLSTSQYAMHRDTAVLIQAHLAEVGIAVKLTMPDWATRVSMGVKGVGDFGIDGRGLDTLDPDAAGDLVDPTLAAAYSRSRNFEVPGLSDLLVAGRQELDETKRVAIYNKIDRLVCDNASFGGLAYRATGFARSRQLQNLALLPAQLSPFSGVLFDRLSLG